MPRKFPTIYPFAESLPAGAASPGLFAGARPMGVTVHYSADRDLARLRRSLKEKGLGYHLIIERNGDVHQGCFLDRRTNHAGKALWRELSPNRWHASVALMSWGKLDAAGRSWSGAALPPDEIEHRPGRDGVLALWDGCTLAQERKLVWVLRWFVACGIDPANICGHDEAALPAGRKIDPGGCIRWGMEELRALASSPESDF